MFKRSQNLKSRKQRNILNLTFKKTTTTIMKSQELGTSTTRIKLNFAMRYISSQNFVDHNDCRRRRRRRLWRLRCPSNPKDRKSCKYKENLWFLLFSKTTNSIASNLSPVCMSVCLSLYRLLLNTVRWVLRDLSWFIFSRRRCRCRSFISQFPQIIRDLPPNELCMLLAKVFDFNWLPSQWAAVQQLVGDWICFVY